MSRHFSGGFSWSWHSSVLGFRVTKLTLGKDVSRFVGTAVATYAYYYVAHSYWHGASVWVQVLVPGALVVSGCVYAVKAWKNRADEVWAALTSSSWLLLATGLIVSARYLLSG